MKHSVKICLVLSLLMLAFGCRKFEDIHYPRNPDVYIAITDGGVAKYAKNGKITTLTDGSNFAGTQSIFVSGKDVYVAGFEIVNDITVAKYWKNGNEVLLTDGTNNAIAASIIVVGNDVYVAGTESNGSVDVARYWKNGKVFLLTDGTDGTKDVGVGTIFISGNDVYVSGKESSFDFETFTLSSRPMYWKNGRAVILSDGGCNCSPTNSIFVSGNDVYVSGSAPLNAADGYASRAAYWKNGNLVLLDNKQGGFSSEANNLFVSGKDVYLAGYQADFNEDFTEVTVAPRTWKNGAGTSMVPTSEIYAAGIGLFVADNFVYVSGTVYNDSGNGVATYWTNGQATSITDGTKSAWSNSIFITP